MPLMQLTTAARHLYRSHKCHTLTNCRNLPTSSCQLEEQVVAPLQEAAAAFSRVLVQVSVSFCIPYPPLLMVIESRAHDALQQGLFRYVLHHIVKYMRGSLDFLNSALIYQVVMHRTTPSPYGSTSPPIMPKKNSGTTPSRVGCVFNKNSTNVLLCSLQHKNVNDGAGEYQFFPIPEFIPLDITLQAALK
ncbi:hypothetical protein JR316_0001575 [Psilocybe cubensis]|uniref:Uncharacterized protein n=1 Tax=Psilocybe cubensis TaxID=181762 RepID=A0ACB8HB19_PSICU|nr:hypothetical protein JR316_0001575 [Psilocybe cubensis]KAH9484676.1 hypothetical protein JR316_0001575 [Psilocybe cubensis]